MPLSPRQREFGDLLGLSQGLIEDVLATSGNPVCPKCEEGSEKCRCDLDEFPFGMGEALQGPVTNAEMNRKKDITADPGSENPAVQEFDPTRKTEAQKEAEREKKLRDKMADEVQSDLRKSLNTKNDSVTFYPSTESQR